MTKEVANLTEEDLIKEINRLTKEAKQRELTTEEKEYRELLRERFIKNFREGLAKQLDSVKVVDEKGNVIKDSNLDNKKKD